MYSQTAFSAHHLRARRTRYGHTKSQGNITHEPSEFDTKNLLIETLTVIVLYIAMALAVAGASVLFDLFVHLF